MAKLVAFFVRNKVWANVVMFSIFGFGIIFLNQLRFSFFPETDPSIIIIQVVYPGASPEEVEEGVILKIEENLDGLTDIEQITSVSRENSGSVTVEITKDADIDRVLADVKNAVDRINSFPLDIEKPVIFEQKFRLLSLSVVLYGKTDLYNLKYIADNLRDELLATPEISQVTIQGLPRLEFSIEVSEEKLRRYQLTFNEIAAAVGEANINLSGGKFETSSEEILIRAYGKNYFADQLKNIVLRGNPDGTVVYLRDVADIREQWENVPDKTYYNGHNAVVLNIDQSEQEDILAIAEKTKQIIATFNQRNNEVTAQVLDDRTVPLRQRTELLARNGLMGLMLILITLGFFLNLRLSFWVAMGIPFSFAGMFIVANLVGITINVISLFGMIIVVGILVDDAIVVGENIYAHYERGKPARESAIVGTREMLAPVFTSVFTTVLAFLPFFFLDGIFGKFFWEMGLVVVAALCFSLVEAFLVLPAHLAHSRGLHPHKEDPPMRQRIEKWISHLTHRLYGPALKQALKHKWITVVLPVAMVMITIGLIGGGIIGVTIFPFIDGDTLPINLSLVSGRQEADTDSLLARIERVAWQVNKEFSDKREDGRQVVLGIKRDIGQSDFGDIGSHTGRLTLQLLDGESRNLDSYVIANRIRELVGPVPEAQNITFGRVGHFGKPVSVSLLGNDLAQLNLARDLLVSELEDMSALKDITDSNQKGRRELDIRLKPRAYALGLSLRDVAGQVRQGFFGQEIQRIQRGRDEIRVWVRYRPEDRSALGFLDRMRIRTPSGEEYPFSELASYKIERGITAIQHLNRLREIRVEANLTDQQADLPPILAGVRNEIVPRVLNQVHGVQVSYEGQSRDQQKFQRSMKKAFPLALLGMFILVVLVFRSYAQAGMIFSLIPIGVLGAIWGHGIQGIQVNTLSIYGIIALSGIIINDSIVMIDQINRNLRNGQKVIDAVYNGGIARLRPILLTSITTAVGLAPLMLETSRQAQFLIPMAVSVAYGLIFGTVIQLFILPALFLVVNRLRCLWVQFYSRREVAIESVEPAIQALKEQCAK